MPLRHEAPPEPLRAELGKVAAAASDLIEAFRNPGNVVPLPDGYPSDSLLTVLSRLMRLPEGTAEGALGPLQIARRRLSREQLKHFVHVPADSEADGPPPALARDGHIDRALQRASNAVQTALEAYWLLAEEEDAVRDAPTDVFRDAASDERRGFAASAANLTDDLDAAADDLKARGAGGYPDADRLMRIERAAATETATAAAEATETDAQPSMLEAIGERMSRYSVVGVEAGRLLATSADVALLGWKFVDQTVDAFTETLFGRVAAAGVTLSEISRRVRVHGQDMAAEARGRRRPEAAPPSVSSPNQQRDEITQDEAEAQARANLLAGRETPPEIAALVRTLNLDGSFGERRSLPRPELLAAFDRLQTISLTHTDIDNVENLRTPSALKALTLDGTGVSDLDPLRNLSQLEMLGLNGTGVSDLDPLRNLSKLRSLFLDGTGVSDLDPLRNLSKLVKLHLRGTGVRDWSPVDHVDDVRGRPDDWRRERR